MLKFLSLLIFLFLINFTSYSQDFNRVHELVVQGQEEIFNVDFDKAISSFREAKSIAPNDPRGPFFESSVYFWKSMLTRNKNDYKTYLDLSEKLIENIENIIDKNKNDLNARFYLGWTYTLRAFITYYIDQNVLRAASDIKDAEKNLTFVTEKDKQFHDAYLGLGMYNYIVSLIPSKYQWLTSILGFDGNRELGKRYLILASDNGVYTNIESKFYLTLLSWREENYPEAEGYAQAVISKFPSSPAIWMLWGLLMSQQDKMPEAISAYEKAIQFNKGKESDIVLKMSYGALGTAYFRVNDFNKSVEYSTKYINYLTEDDRINHRLYALGVSLELLGRRSEALSYYGKAKTKINEDNDWERYWLRRVNYRAANPLTEIDSLLIIADNFRSVGKLNESNNIYQVLLNDNYNNSNDDIKAQINHGIGQLYFKQKDHNKAIEYFRKNISLKPNNEKWLVPEAYFQMGRNYMAIGNRSEAEKFFDLAEDVDYDYDFKNSMDRKIKNELTKK